MKRLIFTLVALFAIGSGCMIAESHSNPRGNGNQRAHQEHSGSRPGQSHKPGEGHKPGAPQPPGHSYGHGPGHGHWSPAPPTPPRPVAPPPPPPAPRPPRYYTHHSYQPHYVTSRPSIGVTISFGGVSMWFSDGVYYQAVGPGRFAVVMPPIGLQLTALPGYSSTWYDRGFRYYLYNNVVYREVRQPYGVAYQVAGYV